MRARTTTSLPSGLLGPVTKAPVKTKSQSAKLLVAQEGVPVVVGSRDRLLETASRLFLNGSYHGCGIAEICAAASVQKGTFYHFFPSKTDLLLAVIDVRVRETEAMIAEIAAAQGPASRKIVRLFLMSPGARDLEEPRDAQSPGFLLGNVVLELGSQNPPVRKAAKAAFDLWIQGIETIVVQLVAEEKLTNLDTKDAAEAVLGLLQGAAVMASAYNEPRKMRAYAQVALSLLRAGNQEGR
jgi:TetR/AcrR family transcriptional regulator, transcriptional repressor for nem operon